MQPNYFDDREVSVRILATRALVTDGHLLAFCDAATETTIPTRDIGEICRFMAHPASQFIGKMRIPQVFVELRRSNPAAPTV